jgi:hypothetical protein
MARKLVFTVEVDEPSSDDIDYEEEILKLLSQAFINIVSLLDYSANNTWSSVTIPEVNYEQS